MRVCLVPRDKCGCVAHTCALAAETAIEEPIDFRSSSGLVLALLCGGVEISTLLTFYRQLARLGGLIFSGLRNEDAECHVVLRLCRDRTGSTALPKIRYAVTSQQKEEALIELCANLAESPKNDR